MRRVLWDVSPESLGLEHSAFLIERILELGDEEACRWLFQQFPRDEIRKVAQESRRLSRKSAGFWAIYFGLPADQVRSLAQKESGQTGKGGVLTLESRDELHRLMDALPERKALLARRLLEVLLEEARADPLLRTLYNAPADDEPVTPAEAASVKEALRSVAAGEVVPDDELWKRLGCVPPCGDRKRRCSEATRRGKPTAPSCR